MNKIYEISGIDILEDENSFYGPVQHWYKKKLHAESGCGPTTAALAMAYLASNEESCSALYPYETPYTKDDFLQYMEDIRLFLKPGVGPLTDPNFFGCRTVEYAKTKSIDMQYGIFEKSLDAQEAFEKVTELLDKNIMPSLLILRNPYKEINEFTWHWMSVTGYIRDSKEILIATYGEKHILAFEKIWQQQKPYSTDIVYFYV